MRIRVLRAVIFLFFAVLLADLFYLQIIRGQYYFSKSENNRIRLVPEEASRGKVYDSRGRLLIDNRLVFDVVATLPEKSDEKQALLRRLAPYLNKDPEELILNCTGVNSSFFPILLAKNLDREKALLIEQDQFSLPGVFVKPRAVRYYPHKESCAHITGYVGKMREKDYPVGKKLGYSLEEDIGRSGIEKVFDERLRGRSGGMQLEVDGRNSIIKVLSYRAPTRGQDLRLTIDAGLQELLREEFGPVPGGAVVMDADTGAVIAMYSNPSFDPNIFTVAKDRKGRARLLKDIGSPLLNRCLQVFPAGSIFKIVTAYAALAQNVISSGTMFECRGEYPLGGIVFHCWLHRGHGNIDLGTAIATSCNVYFWHAARILGEKEISRYARLFGFGQSTGIELPGEASGIVPDAQWKISRMKEQWFPGDTFNLAIGQGFLLVSPLQACRMTAMVANGGYEVNPRLESGSSRKGKKVLSDQNLDSIRLGMLKAVNEAYGTAHKARVKGIRVYGKTGTAQVGSRESHGWFSGFALFPEQKISIAVVAEHGGSGGDRPTEIAAAVIEFIRKEYEGNSEED